MTPHLRLRAFVVGAVLTISAVPAFAATCGTGSFASWLDDFKADAAAKGISQSAIASGLNGVAPDQAVLSRDRSQKVFSQSFEEFSGRMVPPRLTRGANMMKQYGSVLSRIEQSYGVPGEVLVAIWVWRRISASTPENSRPSARWPRWLTIAGAPRPSGAN